MVDFGLLRGDAVDLNNIKPPVAMPMSTHKPTGAGAQNVAALGAVDGPEARGETGSPGMGLDLNKHDTAFLRDISDDIQFATAVAMARTGISFKDAPTKTT